MLRRVAGHPLIGWATRAAAASSLTRVIVSTDEQEIADVAGEYGVQAPFIRPAHLAGDNVGNDEVVNHALNWAQDEYEMNFDVVVLIQPTVPFVRCQDIDACIEGVTEQKSDCCFTVKQVSAYPEWMFRDGPGGMVEQVLPGPWLDKKRKLRAIPATYLPNGAVWSMRSDAFLQSGTIYNPPLRKVLMEEERSVDIDFKDDLDLAESMAAKHDFLITPSHPRGD